MTEVNAIYNSGNKEPFVKLEDYTIKTILSLMDHCELLKIDNVSYDLNHEETVYLIKYKTYWELILKSNSDKTTDIYKIEGEPQAINYQYSETL